MKIDLAELKMIIRNELMNEAHLSGNEIPNILTAMGYEIKGGAPFAMVTAPGEDQELDFEEEDYHTVDWQDVDKVDQGITNED